MYLVYCKHWFILGNKSTDRWKVSSTAQITYSAAMPTNQLIRFHFVTWNTFATTISLDFLKTALYHSCNISVLIDLFFVFSFDKTRSQHYPLEVFRLHPTRLFVCPTDPLRFCYKVTFLTRASSSVRWRRVTLSDIFTGLLVWSENSSDYWFVSNGISPSSRPEQRTCQCVSAVELREKATRWPQIHTFQLYLKKKKNGMFIFAKLKYLFLIYRN